MAVVFSKFYTHVSPRVWVHGWRGSRLHIWHNRTKFASLPDIAAGDAQCTNSNMTIVHVALPLVFAVVLLGLIRKGPQNAATWSSISHQLQSSFWPTLLFSDGTNSRNVEKGVVFVSYLVTGGIICFIIAGFLTPKPLLESIRASDHTHISQFHYAPGRSPSPQLPI